MIMARICSRMAGLPNSVSAMTVNRYCSSGLQAIAIAAQQIAERHGRSLRGRRRGEHVARLHELEGRAQPHADGRGALALHGHGPHRRAGGATLQHQPRGPGPVRPAKPRASRRSHPGGQVPGRDGARDLPAHSLQEGKAVAQDVTFDTDEGVRYDTSLEAMAKLKPAFGVSGTVTAGTSSQMSDGAAAVVMMSDEKAAQLGPQAAGHLSAASSPSAATPTSWASAPRWPCPSCSKRPA